MDLEKTIIEMVKARWLHENEHLRNAGFSPDILSTPSKIGQSQAGGGPLIRCVPSDEGGWVEDIQNHFPNIVCPLIQQAAENIAEAGAALEEIFCRIQIREQAEEDGDHHSITYGEPVFTAYYLDIEEAVRVARDTDRLRDLVHRRLGKESE
jgi:hypothetical protein